MATRQPKNNTSAQKKPAPAKKQTRPKANPKGATAKPQDAAVSSVSSAQEPQKKSLADIVNIIANSEPVSEKAKEQLIAMGVPEEDINSDAVLALSLYQSAINGDLKALEKWQAFKKESEARAIALKMNSIVSPSDRDEAPTTGRGGKNNFTNVVTNEPAEDSRRIQGEILKWFKMPRVKDDKDLEERMMMFFDTCYKSGERPTWEKFCLSIGYHRRTVWEWENGEGCTPQRANLIRKAKDYLASYDAGLAVEGKINPVPYIFRAKNYYGLKDQQEVVVTPNQPLGGEIDANEIAERYTKLPESKDEVIIEMDED